MSFKTILVLVTATLAMAQKPPRAAYSSILDEVFPHFADGGGWKSTITLVNLGDAQSKFKLSFFAPDGRPRSVPMRGFGSINAVYEGTLPVNGSVTLETSGVASTTITGWARVEADERIGGTLVFTQLQQGGRVSEAAIPLTSWGESEFRMAYDNTDGLVTSMALCHPGTFTVESITVAIFDDRGQRIALDQFDLQPGQQQAFTLPDKWTATAGRRGSIRVTSRLYLSAFGLRFHPSGSFTTVNTMAY